MAKFEVDETDLFFLRCAATDYLLYSDHEPHDVLKPEIIKALENTKLKDLRGNTKSTN